MYDCLLEMYSRRIDLTITLRLKSSIVKQSMRTRLYQVLLLVLLFVVLVLLLMLLLMLLLVLLLLVLLTLTLTLTLTLRWPRTFTSSSEACVIVLDSQAEI